MAHDLVAHVDFIVGFAELRIDLRHGGPAVDDEPRGLLGREVTHLAASDGTAAEHRGAGCQKQQSADAASDGPRAPCGSFRQGLLLL